MDEVITVLGCGAMGTACAFVLAQNPDRQITLWARNSEFAAQIQETRENTRRLPGVLLPGNIHVTSTPAGALRQSQVVVMCVPTRGIREACSQLSSMIPVQALLVSAVKGIENETLIRPTEMLRQLLGERPLAALGGPCHAEEVARRLPASIVAASDDPAAAVRIQTLFSTEFLRVYTNTDLLGVELAAALKNVIAIAAGICDGLKFGDNARAALMTRGLAEMVRFGTMLGAQQETFYGLAGIGDLAVTCGSRHSRNRAVGEMLGQGKTLSQIEAATTAVAEGVFTARSVVQLAREKHIDMPIAEGVYRVLFEGLDPAEATGELMSRPLKTE